MSIYDSFDGSDLYSSDMKSSNNQKNQKETTAPKTDEAATEALDLYLESDSSRLMRMSIEKSSTGETQVEERREKALENKKGSSQENASKSQEGQTSASTNQQSLAASKDDAVPQSNQNTSNSTKKVVLLPSHAKQTGQASKKVAQLWESEAAVDIKTRRQRYRCNNDFVTAESIPTWDEYSQKHFKPLANPPLFSVNEDINNKVAVIAGSVTHMEVDAIVNAANEACLGGAGVDGAIHAAAGKLLLEECKTLKGCKTGQAKITRGYNLPASYVIHTVGPKTQNEGALRSCYQSCLDLAVEFEIRTLAFCCISVGMYGYPLQAATKTALDTVRKWLDVDKNRAQVDKIIFVMYLDKEKNCYEDLMPTYFPTQQHVAGSDEKEKQAQQKQEELKKLEEKAKQEEKQRQEEQKREEERRQKEAAEAKRIEENKKKEEERRQKEEENRKKTEAENKKKEEEQRKLKEAEENKRKEEARKEQERIKKEEDERKQKEAKRIEEENRKKEEERRQKEEESRKKIEAENKKKEEERKQIEAARKLEEERKTKEEAERKQKEAEAKKEEERKKEQRMEKQQQEAAKQAPSPSQSASQSEQKLSKPEATPTPTPTPYPTPVPSSQGVSPYLIGGIVGTTLIAVATFFLFKRR